MRKLLLTWQEPDRDPFTEQFMEGERGSFSVGYPDPVEWGKRTLDRFNATLRQGELPRTLIRAEVVDLDRREEKSVRVEHSWHKTNVVTISDQHGLYDAMRCGVCGVTGKRFGLGGNIRRDRDFAAKAFESCNGAQALLERRQRRVKRGDTEAR